ncbi:MAG: alpha/beta fold hydrolase [Thermomicrobium sp.]|nr:alpha/beta fold hydrolase [Thermomicrobium sp.]
MSVSVQESTVQAGRWPTHLHRAGQGQPVIFLHGSGPGVTAWANWRFAVPALADEFDCIAPDLWGFARSGHPDPPPVGARAWMDLWVEQVIALMDHLGIERAHVVGNSMGGAIALHLLHRHRERFERVVLMGTAGAPHRITQQLDVAWGFYEEPTAERLAQIIRWFVYDPATVGGDLEAIARDRLQAALDPVVRRSYEAMFPAPRQQHLEALVLPEEAYRAMDRPVLLVHGRDDVIVPLETSLWLLPRLPRVQLHVFGQCSHWVQIEKRDSFNALIRAFLRGEL